MWNLALSFRKIWLKPCKHSSVANGGKPINAQRTVTAHSPLTEDLDEEMKLMEEEEDTAAQRNNMIGLTMGCWRMKELSFHERQFLQCLFRQQGSIKYLFDEFVRRIGPLLA